MAKKTIGETVSAKCTYCEFSISTNDQNTLLCEKCGVTDPESACKKFRYDPLKRAPRRPAALPQFSSEDFKL